jgi:hypothetical protein
MGAPVSSAKSADQPAAETLLTAFKTINAAERRKHASVLNYWLSIRGDKEFPPLHDLDPLELSDAGPNSILLELISGGHDAEVRHLGEGLVGEERVERIIDAPSPSILACIAKKLPIVAISRDFLAFEDEYEGDDGQTRCWVTLLPLSAGGAWVDYVYALVSADSPAAKAASKKSSKKPEPEPEEIEEAAAEEIEEPVAEEAEAPVEELPEESEAVLEEPEAQESAKPVASAVAKAAPGFSKLFDSLAGLTGFYGSQPVKVEPVAESEEPVEQPIDEAPVEQPAAAEEPDDGPVADDPPVEEAVADEPVDEEVVAEEPVVEEMVADDPVAEKPASKQPEPASASEGTLQKKLTEVRTKTDEARLAKIRANAALYEGLSAAYDFALDAEDAPEEYLRLVEAQGLKIQLRSPMKPVVKLAFEGMCDEATIRQLEAVLAWAFEQELPRGTLAERIEQAGGVGYILNGEKKAA